MPEQHQGKQTYLEMDLIRWPQSSASNSCSCCLRTQDPGSDTKEQWSICTVILEAYNFLHLIYTAIHTKCSKLIRDLVVRVLMHISVLVYSLQWRSNSLGWLYNPGALVCWAHDCTPYPEVPYIMYSLLNGGDYIWCSALPHAEKLHQRDSSEHPRNTTQITVEI